MMIGGCLRLVLLIVFILNLIYGKGIMKELSQSFRKSNPDEVDLDYLIYFPEIYENSTKTFPLVLFLHGAGERGKNLEDIKIHGIPRKVNEGSTFPFICIAPQCPEEGYWDRPEYVTSLINLLKEVEQKHRIDSDRIYGTGLSMGGLGTLAMAIREPELFAAIIPICGGADMEEIDRLETLPIWLFHGDRDDVIPLDNSIEIYQALRSKNKDILLTVYADVYHDSWSQTYDNDNIFKWLLKYKK